jgi:hypothetical protein
MTPNNNHAHVSGFRDDGNPSLLRDCASPSRAARRGNGHDGIAFTATADAANATMPGQQILR